jgi:hypothetical protein
VDDKETRAEGKVGGRKGIIYLMKTKPKEVGGDVRYAGQAEKLTWTK